MHGMCLAASVLSRLRAVICNHLPASSSAVVSPLGISITLEPQSAGGHAIRSSLLRELIGEGSTLEETIAQVPDAVQAVLELCDDPGKASPAGVSRDRGTISYETLILTGRGTQRLSESSVAAAVRNGPPRGTRPASVNMTIGPLSAWTLAS